MYEAKEKSRPTVRNAHDCADAAEHPKLAQRQHGAGLEATRKQVDGETPGVGAELLVTDMRAERARAQVEEAHEPELDPHAGGGSDTDRADEVRGRLAKQRDREP